VATPFRSAEVRPEAASLRLSWWALAMSVLSAGSLGTFIASLKPRRGERGDDVVQLGG